MTLSNVLRKEMSDDMCRYTVVAFEEMQEIRTESRTIVSQYDESWYRSNFDHWINRHHRCVAFDGEYFKNK